MGPIYTNNKLAISQPHRWTSVTLANGESFDGTDYTTHSSQRLQIQGGIGKATWRWGEGFIIQPSADIGTLDVIPYGDWVDNQKSYTNLATQYLYSLIAGVWNEARVIKVTNNTGSSITFNIGI